MTNNANISGLTTWIQSGDTWGIGSVGSTTITSGTHTFTNVPAGDYYVYVSPIVGTEMSNYRKSVVWNNTNVATTVVTNGNVNAWKTTSKVTVSGNSTLKVTINYD